MVVNVLFYSKHHGDDNDDDDDTNNDRKRRTWCKIYQKYSILIRVGKSYLPWVIPMLAC